MALPLIDAHILALFATDIFLGVHLVTFVFALWTQISNNPARGRRTNWLLVAVTIAMGVIGILNAALDVFANILAWSSGNINIFTESSALASIIVKADEAIPPLIGDAMLIYRCWLVYQRRWKAVILSIFLWTSCVALGIFVIVKSAVRKYPGGINSPELRPFSGAALAITVVLNVITTLLIVRRIWSTSRQLRINLAGRDRLQYVIRVIIESGFLYTATAIVVLCTTVVGSNADYITGESFVQITGIAFNLIIIRFDQNLADENQAERPIILESSPCGSHSSDYAHQDLEANPYPAALTRKEGDQAQEVLYVPDNTRDIVILSSGTVPHVVFRERGHVS